MAMPLDEADSDTAADESADTQDPTASGLTQ
jgi:hypothetical protein